MERMWGGAHGCTDKEEQYAGNCVDYCFDFDVGGLRAKMALQSRVGVLPERRAGHYSNHPDHPPPIGSNIVSPGQGWCHARKSRSRILLDMGAGLNLRSRHRAAREQKGNTPLPRPVDEDRESASRG